MAGKPPYINHLKSYKNLVTTSAEVRAGFISFALEKNRRSTPFVDRAKKLKISASKAKSPEDLKNMLEIKSALLTASGLSDKALNHLAESDKDKAVQELVDNFLKPAGKDFVDELVFRYLLIQGDSLGGSMRNIVGAMAMQKLTRSIISVLSNAGIEYLWLDNHSDKKRWIAGKKDDHTIEENLKAIYWKINGKDRLLAYNILVPIVENNIDIMLFDAKPEEYSKALFSEPKRYIMLGELKGGIDPAGADEHWKTGNSALDRIRKGFSKHKTNPKILFIAAAIESKMAGEIWSQLESGEISNAGNLTDDSQITHVCNWILSL